MFASGEFSLRHFVFPNLFRFLIASVSFAGLLMIFALPTIRNFYVERLTSSVAEIPVRNYSVPRVGWSETDHLTDCIALSINVPDGQANQRFWRYPVDNPAIYQTGGTAIGCQQLTEFLLAPSENYEYVSNYSRFWHGYIVIIQPLVMVGGIKFASYTIAAVLIALTSLLFLNLERRARGSGLLFLSVFLIQPNANILLSMSHTISLIVVFVFCILILNQDIDGFHFILKSGFVFGAIIGFVSWLTYPALFVGLPVAVICTSTHSRGIRLAFNAAVSCSLIFLGWGGIWLLKIKVSQFFGISTDLAMNQFNAWVKQPDYAQIPSKLLTQVLSHLKTTWYLAVITLAALVKLQSKSDQLSKLVPGLAIPAVCSAAYWIPLNGHSAHSFSYTNFWGIAVLLMVGISTIAVRSIRLFSKITSSGIS